MFVNPHCRPLIGQMNQILWAGLSASIAYLMSSKGYKKKSLSKDGAISAFFVGFISFFVSLQMGIVLIGFFVSSSILTRLGAKKKAQQEDGYVEGGQRTTVQVLSNSLPALACAVVWWWHLGVVFTIQHTVTSSELLDGIIKAVPSWAHVHNGVMLAELLFVGVIAHYACCCGDTWASELGALSTTPPRFILAPWRTVPAGTNGGVTVTGLFASAMGGGFIGLVAFISSSINGVIARAFTHEPVLVYTGSIATTGSIIVLPMYYVSLGLFAGLVGSLLDSVLGATVQLSLRDSRTGRMVSHVEKEHLKDTHYVTVSGIDLLDNHQVNLVSAAVTSLAAMTLHLWYTK